MAKDCETALVGDAISVAFELLWGKELHLFWALRWLMLSIDHWGNGESNGPCKGLKHYTTCKGLDCWDLILISCYRYYFSFSVLKRIPGLPMCISSPAYEVQRDLGTNFTCEPGGKRVQKRHQQKWQWRWPCWGVQAASVVWQALLCFGFANIFKERSNIPAAFAGAGGFNPKANPGGLSSSSAGPPPKAMPANLTPPKAKAEHHTFCAKATAAIQDCWSCPQKAADGLKVCSFLGQSF